MAMMGRSTNPRVSIGLPVYNGERFLPQALEALLSQTFSDFLLVISDNASTDATEDICRTYAARDRRIRYLRNEYNVGVYKNFNRVFRESTGDYFKWACADDVSDHNLVARCFEIIEQKPDVVVVYPKTRFIDEAGRRLDTHDQGWHLEQEAAHERLRAILYADHWVNLFYGLIRHSALARTRLFPSYNSGDYRLIGELSLQGKFLETPEELLSRRLHRHAASQNSDPEWQAQFHSGVLHNPGLPLCHLCVDHALTIAHSQLSFTQKCYLGGALLHRVFLAKRQLADEFFTASRCYFRHLLQRPHGVPRSQGKVWRRAK